MPGQMKTHRAQVKYNVTTDFPHLGLHSAAVTGNVGLVKYALEHGQPVNSVLDGVLPLHAACSGGNDIVVKLLIENGADVNAPRLPRKYSSDRHRDASVPIIGTSGSTPLHFAAANGHTHTVLTLLLHGAHQDLTDKHGITPESLARQNGWNDTADILRDWWANKNRDLLERALPGDELTVASEDVISKSARLRMKRSIDNAMQLFKPSTTSPEIGLTEPSPLEPSYTFYPTPPETADSEGANAPRRPSLPHIYEDKAKPAHSRSPCSSPRRPQSAGGSEDRSAQASRSRKLSSKYSLLSLFNKKETVDTPPSPASSSLVASPRGELLLDLPPGRERLGSTASTRPSALFSTPGDTRSDSRERALSSASIALTEGEVSHRPQGILRPHHQSSQSVASATQTQSPLGNPPRTLRFDSDLPSSAGLPKDDSDSEDEVDEEEYGEPIATPGVPPEQRVVEVQEVVDEFPFSINRRPSLNNADSPSTDASAQSAEKIHGLAVPRSKRGGSVSSEAPSVLTTEASTGSEGVQTPPEDPSIPSASANGMTSKRRPHHATPLDIDIRSISSHAQAEALVQRAQQSILEMDAYSSCGEDDVEAASPHPGTARSEVSSTSGLTVSPGTAGLGAGRSPLSAKLAAYGESLAIEKKLKQEAEGRMGAGRGKENGDRESDGGGMRSAPVHGQQQHPRPHTSAHPPARSQTQTERQLRERKLSLEQPPTSSPRARPRLHSPRRPNTSSGIASEANGFTTRSSLPSDRPPLQMRSASDSNAPPTPHHVQSRSESAAYPRFDHTSTSPGFDLDTDSFDDVSPRSATTPTPASAPKMSAALSRVLAPPPLPDEDDISPLGKHDPARHMASKSKLTRMGFSTGSTGVGVGMSGSPGRMVGGGKPRSFGIRSLMQSFKSRG